MNTGVAIARTTDRYGTGLLLFFIFATVWSGCTQARPPRPIVPPADVYEQAYRAGMQAALSAYQEQYLENDFPYHNWSAPLVQRVWVPPTIQHGLFIPGHMEEVIIKPGAWKREFAAPLSSHQPSSDTRPYTRDHRLGWADRPRDWTEPLSRGGPLSPPEPAVGENDIPSLAVPALPKAPDTSDEPNERDPLDELPAPDPSWLAHK